MSSDYKLAIAIGGKLDASLAASVKSAQSMLDQLNGGKGGGIMQKALSGAGKAITGVAKASVASLGAITSGMIAAGVASVNTGMDFETAMSELAGTAGITRSSEAFAQYQEAAREVGATTNKSATEAVQALQYMALAGWDTQDSIAALDDMVKLSSASNTDLGRTSDLVTDSMGALGLTMKDYGGYMDMVARADSAANYSSAEFMETMIGAGGAARLLGVDISELGTAAGILANNGTKGSEAGTKLNSIFARLAGNSKPVADSLAALGTTITDDSGAFLNFEDMLGNIKESLANVKTEAEQAEIMKNLFGTHNLTEAQYLLDSIGEGGGWDSLQANLENAREGVDEFGNSFDTLNERYQTATDNLKGDLDILKSTVSDFGIEIYNSLVGSEGTGIRGAVQEATKILRDLEDAFKGGGLEGLAKTIGDSLGNVSTTIGAKGALAISKATNFSTNLVKAIGGKSTEIGSAAAKIVTELGNSFLTYTDDFVEAAGNLIKGLCDGLIQEGTADKWGDALGEMVKNIGSWFSENGASLGEAAGTLITQLATQLGEHSGEIIVGGIEITAGLAEGILKGLPILIKQLPGIVGKIAKALVTEGVPALVAAGKDLAGAIWEGLKSITDTQEPVFQSFDESMNPAILQAYQGNLEAVNAEMLSIADARNWEGLNSFTRDLLTGTTSLEEYQAAMAELDTDSLDFDEMSTGLYDFVSIMETAFSNLGIGLEEAAAESETFGPALEEAGIAAEEAGAAAEGASVSIEDMNAQYDELIASVKGVQTAGEGMQEALTIDPSTMDADALSAVLESIDAGNIGQLTAEFDSAMTTITTSANNASTSVQTSVVTMMTVVGANFAQMVVNAATTATSIYNSFASIDLGGVASNMMAGLVEGIRAGSEQAVAEAESIASRIESTMASALKIKSPSKVTEEIGVFTGQGLAVGLEESEAYVYNRAESLAGIIPDNLSVAVQEQAAMPVYDFTAFDPAITDRQIDYDFTVPTADNIGMPPSINTVVHEPTKESGILSGILRTFMQTPPASVPAKVQASPMASAPVTFSPQITINGNANESDVRNALTWSFEQFRQMYRQLQAEDRRTSFA